ncbi:MAG: type IV secretion system protein [Candidatus Midichloriaceae bacterium]
MRYLKLFVVFFFLIFLSKQEARSFDTMVEYENKTRDGSSWFSHIDNCFSSGKAIFQLSVGDFNNVSIPHYLKENNSMTQSSRAGWSELATIGRALLYMDALLSFSPASILALIAIGIEYMIMLDVCTNAYIVAPHEYINIALGYKCDPEKSNGHVKFIQGDKSLPPLTAVDVPFFYHCDPKYDPDANGPLSTTDPDYKEKLDNTYGYMQEASPYCTNQYGKLVGSDATNIPTNGLPSDAPKDFKSLSSGHALVYYTNVISRISKLSLEDLGFATGAGAAAGAALGPGALIGAALVDIIVLLANLFRSQHDSCTFQPDGNFYDITGKSSAAGFFQFIGYYRFNSNIGKVQLCVAAPYTLFPVKVGCTYVPPPVSLVDVPNLNVGEGTRCEYFSKGRTDLKTLGLYINKDGIDNDQYGNKKSVSSFLMSDMHITSTTVGCVLDLLERVFVNPNDNSGFFSEIQKNLKKIVLAAITLYLCLTGIKIMSSGGALKRSDYLMFAIKVALVVYFTLGNAWFAVDEKGNKVGIYYGIIDGSQQIASYFMEAQNMSDPLGHCRFKYRNEQLLSQRHISIESGIAPTAGSNGFVKMTVWDLIDCRVINYLNMGTCNYSFAGLIAVWSITALILVSGIGFVLCIAMFIYSFMLLKIIFKFTHIFILSMFSITILVAVSPIMITFALFDFTKGIYETWFKMLLGYTIYPGLHFAFIALMLATFDNIYFGDLKMDPGSDSIFKQCQLHGSSNSPICAIANNVNGDNTINDSIKDMCDMNIGHIIKGLYETVDLWILGTFTRMNSSVVEALFLTMLKLALMSFLFFMLMNSISTFFAYLTGVESVAGLAKGDLSGAFKKAFGTVAKAPLKAIKKAVTKGGGDSGAKKGDSK